MYKGYRFPREIISHCVLLYHRFTLSLREIELLMAERGIAVSYETIRAWCTRFGPEYARRLRRRQPQTGDRWHLDEVFVTIGGIRTYLWRAVDQHGNILDILIQSKRDGKAATRFLEKILKQQHCRPRVLITDTLASYRVAHRQTISATEHRQNKYLNNRAENTPSTDPATRTRNERLPYRRLSPEVSGLVQSHLVALPGRHVTG